MNSRISSSTQRNESETEPMAMELTRDFGQFLPSSPLSAAPSKGSAMMIQRWLSISI
jgi:hypothetical protein